ncbi:hypothetical protein BDN67DRAFT_206439 [Paxillus ammoniavirescens]|nr:hypothetical protein BDN67DRAFT_206439 [Paxillus ammoniavirescens]
MPCSRVPVRTYIHGIGRIHCHETAGEAALPSAFGNWATKPSRSSCVSRTRCSHTFRAMPITRLSWQELWSKPGRRRGFVPFRITSFLLELPLTCPIVTSSHTWPCFRLGGPFLQELLGSFQLRSFETYECDRRYFSFGPNAP